jgi:putative DNA primase/helicase
MPLDAADGQWPRLLMELGGLTPDQLEDRHQPCPNCEGTDRYRWDRDDGPGGWYCSQCGGKSGTGGAGSGLDLLMRVKGWDFKQATARVEQHLGIEPTPAKPRKPKRPARTPDTPPPDASPPTLGRAVAQWCYRNAAGEQLFWIQRIDQPDGKKLFIHRTWLDGAWHFPSRRDPFTSEWPAPRPLYRLPDLTDRPDAPVIVCEGEKSADAAAELFPDHVTIAWCGGTGGVNTADWSPLADRSVVLWPDADDAGRSCMAKLGPRLLQLGATVAAYKPPTGAPEKWDLANALAEGWKPGQAARLLAANTVELPSLPEPKPEAEPPPPPPPAQTSAIPKSVPFTCLGFDKEGYYYLPHNTGQVVRISRSGHSSTTLCSLAHVNVWASWHPGARGGVDWPAAFSRLFAEQAEVGVFSPDRVRGRGAWLDDGRVVFHVGDRLIVDGESHNVLNPPPTRYFYEQGCQLDGPGPEPLSDDDAHQLTCIAERFRWEIPASAQLLLGWLVLAPVCGALDWRPHLWITGGPGTGKSTVLRDFMRPLLGGVLARATGGTTEPGLRGMLHSDAIPVVFDEFEQNEHRDKSIVQNVLQLARIASSDGGKIYKGTATGGSVSYEIRSMFCVSSINVALIQKADVDRFCVLGLRKDPMNRGDWLTFEAQIAQSSTVDNGRALIARTLQHLPTITKNAKVLAQVLGKRFGQRFGDQHGTLLAGAWSLEKNGGGLLDAQTADQWISQMEWTQHETDASDCDEIKCRNAILQQLVRLDGSGDVSIGELVRAVLLRQAIDRTIYKELEPVLARYGLKTVRKGDLMPGSEGEHAGTHYLAIANSSKQLEAILRGSPWDNGAYKRALRRIDGAVIPTVGIYFSGVGTQRSVLVPISNDELSIQPLI